MISAKQSVTFLCTLQIEYGYAAAIFVKGNTLYNSVGIHSSNSPLIKQNSGVCLVQTTLETDITEQCREQQTTLPINIIIRWLKHLFLLLTRFACSPALRSLRKRYQPTVHFQKTCDGTIFNTASLDTEFRRSRSACRSEHCTKPFSAKFKRTLQLVSS